MNITICILSMLMLTIIRERNVSISKLTIQSVIILNLIYIALLYVKQRNEAYGTRI